MKRAWKAIILCVGIVVASPASAHRESCVAEILSSVDLPFAPVDYWLVKATVRVWPPRSEPYDVALTQSLPHKVSVRPGDAFRFDCDRVDPQNLGLLVTQHRIFNPHGRPDCRAAADNSPIDPLGIIPSRRTSLASLCALYPPSSKSRGYKSAKY